MRSKKTQKSRHWFNLHEVLRQTELIYGDRVDQWLPHVGEGLIEFIGFLHVKKIILVGRVAGNNELKLLLGTCNFWAYGTCEISYRECIVATSARQYNFLSSTQQPRSKKMEEDVWTNPWKNLQQRGKASGLLRMIKRNGVLTDRRR